MRRFFNRKEILTESKTIKEWIFATPNNNTNDQTFDTQQITTKSKPKTNIVTIVYDRTKHKLRAQADDGVHGVGNVAFPNDLRNKEGQQYEVENLIWNGKNYRASGDITPISNTQNITEENYTMNFQSTLAELDKLYEELPAKEKVTGDKETDVLEACTNKLITEAEEEILIDDEPVIDDEVTEEEPTAAEEEVSSQFVLECVECGALVIKDEANIIVGEDTDLVNIEEACQYCEAKKGYKNIGMFTPHESE